MESYTVKFLRKDNTSAEFLFTNRVKAFELMRWFRHGYANHDFNRIALYNAKNNTVERIDFYMDGVFAGALCDGDIVQIKPKYRDTNGDEYLYTVTNINENTGRCLIACINSDMTIAPSEYVDIDMVQVVMCK